MELSQTMCREHCLMSELVKCKREMQKLNSRLVNNEQNMQLSNSLQPRDSAMRLYMEKSLELCKNNGCRVLDCRSDLDVIVTSMKSPNSVFLGYGVRKVSISTYKPTAFIGLHSSPIRDLKFRVAESQLLSVSLDKTVKISCLKSNNVIMSSTTLCPLWSCCWDTNQSNIFYTG